MVESLGQDAGVRKGRIIKVWYPVPSWFELREWVIGLAPREIHKLVLRRLRVRQDLVEAARGLLLTRGLSREGMVEAIGSPIALVERLTITSPVITIREVGNRSVKLLSDEEGEVPYYGSFSSRHPSWLEKFEMDVGWYFIERLLRDLYQPIERYFHLLEEMKDVRGEFKSRRDGHGYGPGLLKPKEKEEGRVDMGEETIGLSRKALDRLSEGKEDSRKGYIILADFHGTNIRNIQEKHHRARQEAKIVEAWTAYKGWLQEKESRLAEVINLLCP